MKNLLITSLNNERQPFLSKIWLLLIRILERSSADDHFMLIAGLITTERASALNFKDTATPRFGHSNVVLNLFIETLVLYLITLMSKFSNLSYF